MFAIMGKSSSPIQMKISLWPQWFAAFHVYVSALMTGTTIGLIPPLLGKLLSSEPPFEVTREQTTWVASLFSLTRPIGSILGTIISIRIGSKQAILNCGMYFACGWICLICANSIEAIYLSLLCNGLGMGTVYTLLPVYIAEIADPKIRGGLMSFTMDGFSMGFLLGNIMGKYLNLCTIGVTCLVPTVLYTISFSFLPHSPYYFIRRDKMDEAVKSIKWYSRGCNDSDELQRLSKFIKDNPPLSFTQTLRQFKTPVNLNALIRINIVYSLVQLIGIFAIVEYMQVLFEAAQITVVAPSSMVIIVGIIGIFSGWTAIYTTDRFNRKTLILGGCIMMSLACIVWGLRYQLLDLGFQDNNLQWMAIAAAIVFRVFVIMGLLPTIPTVMIEMFAPNVRNVGVLVCCMNSAISAFITSKYFQFLIDSLTYKYVFYLIAGLNLLLAIYVKIFLPETKGQTLSEIQAKLNVNQDHTRGVCNKHTQEIQSLSGHNV